MSSRAALLALLLVIVSVAAPALARTFPACANYDTPGIAIPSRHGAANAILTTATARGMAGGYLPAGRNWNLVIDDEFDGPRLNTRIWKDWYTPGTIRETNGGMYQDNRRALSFANGHMIIRGFDASALPGNPRNCPAPAG